MKYAIVESGGKQYKAIEGEVIEVDRLPINTGEKVEMDRVLLLVDGNDISIGNPTLGGVKISTTVMEHFKGPKIIVFKYSPRKRIRVKSGHRQQYTRLRVDVVGAATKSKAAPAKKAAKTTEKKSEPKAEKKVVKKATTAKKATVKKAPVAAPTKGEKVEKTAAKKTSAKKAPAKKTSAKKTSAKKTSAKKTTKKKTATKKSSSTKATKK